MTHLQTFMRPMERQHWVATVQHIKPKRPSSQAVHQGRAQSHTSLGSCFTSLICAGNACLPRQGQVYTVLSSSMRSCFGIQHLVSTVSILFWQTTSCFGSEHLVFAVSILCRQSAFCLGSRHLVWAVSILFTQGKQWQT